MANTATTTDSTADRIEVLESRDARPGIDDMRVVHGVGEGTPVPRRLDELSDSSTMYEIDLDRSTQPPSVTHSDGKPVWTLNKVVSMAVGMASAAAVLGGAVVITQSKSVSSVSKVPYDSPFPRWPGPTTTPLSGTEHATPQALVDELFVPSEDGTPLLDPLRLRNAMERFTTEAMFRGVFGPGSGLPALDVPIEQNVLENDLGRITDGNPPINLPERLLPFSEAQKAGVLMATHAFAATFASLFRYPLGDIPTAIGAKLDTGSAYSDLIAGFTMRKAIVLDPTQFNATTIGSAQFHDLIHHRKRTINPVDTPILLVDEAFTETLTSHVWSGSQFGYGDPKTDVFTMHVFRLLQGGDVLTPEGYRDGLVRLARLLVNGDESEFPAFDAAVRSLLPMNTPEEQTDVKAHYEIIRQLPPVKCRLVDGRIAEYRPLEEPPPQGRAHRFAVGSVVGGTLGVLISASALAAMRRDARSDAARDPERPEAPLNGNGGVELHVMFAETVDHPESKEPVARAARAEEDEAIAGPPRTEPLQGQGPTKEATEESAGNGPGLTPI